MVVGWRKDQVNINMILVEILHTKETGEWLWAVQFKGTDDWLDAFLTEEEAISYCGDNGYKISEHKSHK